MAGGNGYGKNGRKGPKVGTTKKCNKPSPYKLTPAQIAVVAGILTNALEVDSILIGKDKRIEILLQGSLQGRSRMDELMDEFGEASVGDLLETIMRKYK
ncbi:hypothetical protein SY83_10290 [Paenibacillus swuensis]|uniref:Uncharacterized protein n=1 Tax=Paenibacillus swuensis TaxID=1178515 RepID=A0A172TIA7_9BACL|nr:hypothetical protein [Paenibacillus swuensis]ANE46597.1 hypothetical protein SY83_10290 [Paenibacillus swuensis]